MHAIVVGRLLRQRRRCILRRQEPPKPAHDPCTACFVRHEFIDRLAQLQLVDSVKE